MYPTQDIEIYIKSYEDEIYNKKIKAYIFGLTEAYNLLNSDKYKAEYNEYVAYEGDTLENIPNAYINPSNFVGFWFNMKSYDTVRFINEKKKFIDKYLAEYIDKRGITGTDNYDSFTGEYKFIQTEFFIFEKPDDINYDNDIKKYVMELSQIVNNTTRLHTERLDYAQYTNNSSKRVHWPDYNNRYAYWKNMQTNDKTKFENLKKTYTLNISIPDLFDEVATDKAYEYWIKTMIFYDQLDKNYDILDKKYKPRVDIEVNEYNAWKADKNKPLNRQNRYAYWTYMKAFNPNKYADEVKLFKGNQDINNDVEIAFNKLDVLHTTIKSFGYMTSSYMTGTLDFKNVSTYVLSDFISQIVLPTSDYEYKDDQIYKDIENLASDFMKDMASNYLIFKLLQSYGPSFLYSNKPFGDIHQLINMISGQTLAEFGELFRRIKKVVKKNAEQKKTTTNAPSQLDQIFGAIFEGNPLAPPPPFIKKWLDTADNTISDVAGVANWILNNLDIIGIVAGAILLLLLVGFIWSEFKPAQSITIKKD